ncbi:MAG TPA: hypothetical protein VHC49_20955 [Mycobacteriales bacterium]|nr:hypothetical protein [Mycobacteriales bacterium]
MALPFGVFFTVIPGLLLLAEDPGTAGFVITTLTLVIGVIFLIIGFIGYLLSRRSTD